MAERARRLSPIDHSSSGAWVPERCEGAARQPFELPRAAPRDRARSDGTARSRRSWRRGALSPGSVEERVIGVAVIVRSVLRAVVAEPQVLWRPLAFARRLPRAEHQRADDLIHPAHFGVAVGAVQQRLDRRQVALPPRRERQRGGDEFLERQRDGHRNLTDGERPDRARDEQFVAAFVLHRSGALRLWPPDGPEVPCPGCRRNARDAE